VACGLGDFIFQVLSLGEPSNLNWLFERPM
jgi:hypothetical protein